MKKMRVFVLAVLTVSTVYASAVEITGGRRDKFNDGERCGELSIITDEHSEKFEALNIASIPVFTFFPAELSTVAGVITMVKQPRVSHIALKAKDWQIPNADISGAACVQENSDDLLSAFTKCFPEIKDGDFVYIKAQRDGRVLTLEKTDATDPRCPSLVTQIGEVSIVSDLTFSTVADHSELGWEDFDKVGSKAANYAELLKAMNAGGEEVVRPGFAIPFYYYNQFITENLNLKTAIEALLADEKVNNPLEALYRGEKLSALQELIMSDEVKIDESFLLKILERAETYVDSKGLPRRLKFRSSTNAEDLPNFSGAGLYDSKSYKPTSKGKEKPAQEKLESLTKAVKTVWSSIWNKRAYDERALYGIDHSEVYMGIQVNLAFPDELASGVVVTKNIIDLKGQDGVYIEAQRGDEYSVENPAPGVIPERNLVLLNENNEITIDRIGNSTVDVDGLTILSEESTEAVLTDADVQRVTSLALVAETYFENLLGEAGREFALDIEFKVDRDLQGNRTVYFKQARPYLIHE